MVEARGVVNRQAEARPATTYQGERVIEVRATYEGQTTVTVLDRASAKDLAYNLIDILLFGEEN